MPIIFAQAIASLPATIAAFAGVSKNDPGFWGGFLRVFDTTSIFYIVVYFLLIVGFSFFYSTMQFNPVEVANNLKKNGGFIPGFRPGKPTADFIHKVLNKITMFGALYLSLIHIFFGVKVAKVNTLNMQGKEKRTGRFPAGRRPSWKKAMVTLTEDSKTIEFFEGMV